MWNFLVLNNLHQKVETDNSVEFLFLLKFVYVNDESIMTDFRIFGCQNNVGVLHLRIECIFCSFIGV